jgi:cell division protein FtsB
MVDVVATLQHAIEIAGKLRQLSKKVEDAEFKMLLADLSGDLADAKLELANLKVELATLTTENADLRKKLSAKVEGKPRLDKGAYVFEGEEGYFCTACLDVRNQRVRVTELPPSFKRLGTWQCPSCQAVLR